MYKPRGLLVLLACVFCFVLSGAAKPVAPKRGLAPEDYFSYRFIADPRLSPDGKTVAYVVTTIDQKKNRRDPSIWLVPADGSAAPHRMNSEEFNSSNPRWSPDGKTLAFLSTRSADAPAGEAPKPQIYLQPTTGGGEAVRLTKLMNGVQTYQWSPDGGRMVCVSPSGPGDGTATADKKTDVRHYAHSRYKFNDSGWTDDKRSHLWVVSVSSGEAKQITEGQDWADADPQWSPDGTRIAFVSDRTGHGFDESDNTDVWVIPANGGALTKISDHPFQDEMPRWSPDGNRIVFTGKTESHQFPNLYVAASAGGSASQLVLDDLDLIPLELHWPSSDSLLFSAGNRGETHIFRVDLAGRKLSAVTSGARAVHAFDVNPGAGVMVYLANDFQHMDDLYVSRLDGRDERQLTQVNADLWAKLDLQSVEKLHYKSGDGLPIDGFFVKPLGWQPGKKYPMVLIVHGGPEGWFGPDWYQEFQMYAAKGYAVFFCNPRGSTSYGEKFERELTTHYADGGFEDVMAGVDAALKQYPWIDQNRLGVTGGSYGGYLTNWIISHTNRFKAAVALRAVSNLVNDEGVHDGPYGHRDYFHKFVLDDPEEYWNASPLKYARDVHTPVLIMNSDMDFRVPEDQGEQWFRALQHFGVPCELVLFPRENHNITRTGEPKHLVESLNWQFYWFDRYLGNNPNAVPPDAR